MINFLCLKEKGRFTKLKSTNYQMNSEIKYPWGENFGWENRAKRIAEMIPSGVSVLDLGGGMCVLLNYLKNPTTYNSIDIEYWEPHTAKADFNKGEFPEMHMEYQFIVCAGTIEYIKDPVEFLNKIKKYGKILIITYRLASDAKLPMERNNSFKFKEVEKKLKETGWKVLAKSTISPAQKLYYCTKQNEIIN